MQLIVVHQNGAVRMFLPNFNQETDKLVFIQSAMLQFPMQYVIISQSQYEVNLFQES